MCPESVVKMMLRKMRLAWLGVIQYNPPIVMIGRNDLANSHAFWTMKKQKCG